MGGTPVEEKENGSFSSRARMRRDAGESGIAAKQAHQPKQAETGAGLLQHLTTGEPRCERHESSFSRHREIRSKQREPVRIAASAWPRQSLASKGNRAPPKARSPRGCGRREFRKPRESCLRHCPLRGALQIARRNSAQKGCSTRKAFESAS